MLPQAGEIATSLPLNSLDPDSIGSPRTLGQPLRFITGVFAGQLNLSSSTEKPPQTRGRHGVHTSPVTTGVVMINPKMDTEPFVRPVAIQYDSLLLAPIGPPSPLALSN